MSYLFDTSISYVDHGSNAVMDNLAEFSILMWMKRTTFTIPAAAQIPASKAGGGVPMGMSFANPSNNVLVNRGYSTTNMLGQSTPANLGLVTDTWFSLAGTMDTSKVPRLYAGTLSRVVTETAAYAGQTTGVGTLSDDSANPMRTGGGSAANQGSNCVYGGCCLFPRALNAMELQLAANRMRWAVGQSDFGGPWNRFFSCILATFHGETGQSFGRITDYSGYNNHGLLTNAGAIQSADRLPPIYSSLFG